LARRGDGIYVRVTPTLLNVLLVVPGAVTSFWWFVPWPDETAEASIMHWLIFTVIRPTIPAWTAAAYC
jgi:hypothetical protein